MIVNRAPLPVLFCLNFLQYPNRKEARISFLQCSGTVTFWYGSGSLDLYLGLRIRILVQIVLFFWQFFCGILIQILLFWRFFAYFLYGSGYINISLKFKDNMSLRRHETLNSRNNCLSLLFAHRIDWRLRIRTKIKDQFSRPKNIRIRNTAQEVSRI